MNFMTKSREQTPQVYAAALREDTPGEDEDEEDAVRSVEHTVIDFEDLKETVTGLLEIGPDGQVTISRVPTDEEAETAPAGRAPGAAESRMGMLQRQATSQTDKLMENLLNSQKLESLGLAADAAGAADGRSVSLSVEATPRVSLAERLVNDAVAGAIGRVAKMFAEDREIALHLLTDVTQQVFWA